VGSQFQRFAQENEGAAMNGQRLLWLSFLFFVPTIFSIPPTENAHGIIVKFRSTEKKTFARRDQLHAQLGTQLVYRPRKSPFDFVIPKSSDKQRDFTELAKLCETYQSASVVAECEINYDLLARNNTSASAPAATTPADACVLTPTHGSTLLKEGTLSPFWAQELSGTDLVAFPRNATRMGVGVKVAIVDQGFGEMKGMEKKKVASVAPSQNPSENHGALALGMLTGPLPFSLQAPLEISHLFEVQSTADYLKLMDKLDEGGPMPSIVQVSVGFGQSSNVAREALKRLSDKAIVIGAAGNNFPAEMDRNDREFPGILIGSVNPDGYPSDTASFGPSVVISAPSDRYLQSTIDGKKAEMFGGSSGASVMVTGVVAAAKSLVPDLTTQEMKILLQKTALPTPNSYGGATGTGSLNAVLFLAVADRIRASGLSGKQRDKALASAPGTKVFKFEKESEAELNKALPTLSQPDASCDAKKMAHAQLRRAFFLFPTGPAREHLAKAYLSQGLVSNARFIENMDKATVMKRIADDVNAADNATRVAAARVAGGLGNEGMDSLIKFAAVSLRSPASDSQGNGISTSAAVKAIASSMPQEERKLLGGKLKAHRDDDVQKLGEEITSTTGN